MGISGVSHLMQSLIVNARAGTSNVSRALNQAAHWASNLVSRNHQQITTERLSQRNVSITKTQARSSVDKPHHFSANMPQKLPKSTADRKSAGQILKMAAAFVPIDATHSDNQVNKDSDEISHHSPTKIHSPFKRQNNVKKATHAFNNLSVGRIRLSACCDNILKSVSNSKENNQKKALILLTSVLNNIRNTSSVNSNTHIQAKKLLLTCINGRSIVEIMGDKNSNDLVDPTANQYEVLIAQAMINVDLIQLTEKCQQLIKISRQESVK